MPLKVFSTVQEEDQTKHGLIKVLSFKTVILKKC